MPPTAEAVADPSKALLQLISWPRKFEETTAVALIGVSGSVIFTELTAIQPFTSEIVTAYNPEHKPVAVAVV